MGAPSPAKRRKRTKTRRSSTYAGAPAPRIRELMDQGWGRRDAEHFGVLELALDIAPTIPEAHPILARDAAIALRWPPVYAGAQAMYTAPDHAPVWRMLADATRDHDERLRFLTLAAISEGKEVTVMERDDLAELFDPGELVVHDAARIAEAAGDFGKALELLEGTIRPIDDPWGQELRHVVAHGDEMPAWRWGRVILAMAVRYCLEPRTVEVATHYASIVLQALGADSATLRTQVAARVQYDQVIHDVVLFDEGGLAAFLDFRLAPEVAARCPGIADWPDAQLGVFRLVGSDSDGNATLIDLASGRTVIIADPGLAREHPVGRCFYGRLARAAGAELEHFAWIPTIVDDLTANRVVRAIRDGAIAEQRLTLLHSGLATRPAS